MKFSYFHLMPWTDLTEAPAEWPAGNAAFDPRRGQFRTLLSGFRSCFFLSATI